MGNIYYKLENNHSSIYIKLKFFNNYYEGIFIKINTEGKVKQFKEEIHKNSINQFDKTYSKSDEGEFFTIQEKYLFNRSRKKIYDEYYKKWKDYFDAKKKSLDNIKKYINKYDYDYCNKLDYEYNINGVIEKKNKLQEIQNDLIDDASLYDIFYEAEHNARIEYLFSLNGSLI